MGYGAKLACLAVVSGALLVLPSAAAAQGGPPPDTEFEKVTLNDLPGEPMDVAVLPDGRVLHTTRPGTAWLHDPKTKQNRWVYVYYSPPGNTPVDDPVTPVNEGDAPFFGTQADWERFKGVIRLSRFKWTGNRIDLGSEQQIMDVPVDRGICCHVGGDIVFDSAGNLILSTGDDTNPFQSDGYT